MAGTAFFGLMHLRSACTRTKKKGWRRLGAAPDLKLTTSSVNSLNVMNKKQKADRPINKRLKTAAVKD